MRANNVTKRKVHNTGITCALVIDEECIRNFSWKTRKEKIIWQTEKQMSDNIEMNLKKNGVRCESGSST